MATTTSASHEPARTRGELAATLLLLGITAVWGSTFFLIKDLVRHVPVPDFLAVRFAIAFVVLLALRPRSVGALTRPERRQGLVLGLLYGAAQILQTVGLDHTAASVSGFITGMYVVLTPIFATVLVRTRAPRSVWAAVALATVGLAVLSLRSAGLAFGLGESLTLASAALYALHIVGLGSWSRPQSAFGLSVVQMAVIAVVCGVAALPGGIQVPSSVPDWLSLLYMALIAGAVALVGQTWAQAHLPATRAAIVMTLEPVWAATFAVIFGGESATWRMLVGGALVLAAMFLVELAPRRRRIEGEVPHLAV
ncbi:MAG: DMT family transporter [Actinomycetes bacterium]